MFFFSFSVHNSTAVTRRYIGGLLIGRRSVIVDGANGIFIGSEVQQTMTEYRANLDNIRIAARQLSEDARVESSMRKTTIDVAPLEFHYANLKTT